MMRACERVKPGPDLQGDDVDTSAMVTEDFEGAVCRANPRMWDLNPDDDGNSVRASAVFGSADLLRTMLARTTP